MKRMGPLDALFLHTEDGISHMHLGSCAIFAGPAPSMEELTSLVESKLHLVERFRQKVLFAPAGLGRPVWVDDAHFDLSYHLRHSAVPSPGDEKDLELLMARLMSQELDRNRPLWEMWLIEGLSEGRWALISKVHHCMVDGVSGTDLMAVLMDASPDAPTAPTQPWQPGPEPGAVRLTLDALNQLAMIPVHQFGAMLRSASNPSQTFARLRETTEGLRSFASRVSKRTSVLSIEGSIGSNRRWAVGRSSLADIKLIRSALGGSVNDVVLTAISGGFRELLIRRGDPVDGVTLTSLVPVSVRASDDHSFNNQVSLMLAELPVGVADPVERLKAVRDNMAQLKASHQAVAGAAVVEAANFMPPVLIALGARVTMSILRKTPQHTVNTVTTNVPGPPYPLFALGRELLEYLPFVPLSEGVRIGIAILSYNGNVTFGVTGDYDSAPDVRFMAASIEAALAELLERANSARSSAAHPSTRRQRHISQTTGTQR